MQCARLTVIAAKELLRRHVSVRKSALSQRDEAGKSGGSKDGLSLHSERSVAARHLGESRHHIVPAQDHDNDGVELVGRHEARSVRGGNRCRGGRRGGRPAARRISARAGPSACLAGDDHDSEHPHDPARVVRLHGQAVADLGLRRRVGSHPFGGGPAQLHRASKRGGTRLVAFGLQNGGASRWLPLPPEDDLGTGAQRRETPRRDCEASATELHSRFSERPVHADRRGERRCALRPNELRRSSNAARAATRKPKAPGCGSGPKTACWCGGGSWGG